MRDRAESLIQLLALVAMVWLVSDAVRTAVQATTAHPSGHAPLLYSPPRPSRNVWLLVILAVATTISLLKLRPRPSLYALGVACFFVPGPILSTGVWIFPWAFTPPFSQARTVTDVPWGGLLLLPVSWVALAASVRAARLGIALYVLMTFAYRVAVQVAFPHDGFRGLWEYPELVLFWPAGVWQVVGYALDAAARS